MAAIEKAKQVWVRLLGCFGDSLLRKFGDEPPPEWVAVISDLSDVQLARGMRRMIGSGKTSAPSLPEFRHFCLRVGHEDDAIENSRALPAPAQEWTGDDWDIKANRLLLAYIVKRLTAEPRAYGPRKASFRRHFHKDKPPENPASAEQERATKILVAYRHAWARDMREGGLVNTQTGEIEPPNLDQQKAAWIDCMARAEVDIAQAMKQAA